jgi:hypothetical protein
MTAASIGSAKAGGYARYLESKTVVPERGDYYLTPDGEMTQAPGQWLASPETLARLGIEGSAVEGQDFIALMEGRHPRTGGWLRPEGAGGGRGGGIDLTLEGTTDCPSRRVAVGGADRACAASLGGSDVGRGGLDES